MEWGLTADAIMKGTLIQRREAQMTHEHHTHIAPLADRLTVREREILSLVEQKRTNRQIAGELFLTHSTVRWYLRQLYAKLGVAGRKEAIARARALGLAASPATTMIDSHNLPAPATPFVGRQVELQALGGLLLDGHVRLLTILGPGGAGKTRLALALAGQQVVRLVPGSDGQLFPHGVWYAPLAPVETTPQVVSAIAGAVGLELLPAAELGRSSKQQLTDFLRRKRALLVLDNVEHLRGAAPFLARMMNEAPELNLVVTSRERLHLQGEHLFWVQGLELPHDGSGVDPARSPAVRLFTNTARRVKPAYSLDEEALAAVVRICQLLEGMPLAIELAASWASVLPPAELEQELRHGLAILARNLSDVPPRHRSMEAALATSWHRLGAVEKDLLGQVSVFRGGFTLEAARAVVSATPRHLRRLLERSWLVQTEGGRFQLHELSRQFAAGKLLRAPDQANSVRDRHSAYYLGLLMKREPDLKGARSEAALKTLMADGDNIFAGWDWAVSAQKFAILSHGAFSLATFCMRFGRYEQGLAAFRRPSEQLQQHVSERSSAGPADLTMLVTLLAWQCAILHEMGALEKVNALGAETLSLLERQELQDTDTRGERALILSWLGWAYAAQDRIVEAQQMLQESISLFAAVGDTWQMARSTYFLGGTGLKLANFDEVVHYNRQVMHLYEQLGDRRWKARAEVGLAYALSGKGEWEEAEERMRSAIGVFQDIGEKVFVGAATALLAETTTYRGRFAQAATLAAESIQQHEYLGGRRKWLRVSHDRWCQAMLHLGDYKAVLARVLIVLDLAVAANETMGAALGQYRAGCAWLGLSQPRRACVLLEESTHSLRLLGARDYLCHVLAALSCAYSGQGQFVQARIAVFEATQIAVELKTALELSRVLAAAGLLVVRLEEVEQAIELYAMARREPFVANSRWYEDIIGQKLDAAAALLPPAVITAAQERGRARDLWTTAEELLAQFSN